MLKRLLLVTLALAVIGACSAPSPPIPLPTDRPDAAADEAKLKADLARWMDDFNAGNADSLARRYTRKMPS